jgi:hypothetical protein
MNLTIRNRKPKNIKNFTNLELQTEIIDYNILNENDLSKIHYVLNWCSKKELIIVAELINLKVKNKSQTRIDYILDIGYKLKEIINKKQNEKKD